MGNFNRLLAEALRRAFSTCLAEDWKYKFDVDSKDIFPEGPDGRSLKITHINCYITLTNDLGHKVIFKCTKKGNFYDSRDGFKTPMTERDVRSELTRLLGQDVAAYLLSKVKMETQQGPKTNSSSTRPMALAPKQSKSTKAPWVKRTVREPCPKGGACTTVYINPDVTPAPVAALRGKGLMGSTNPAANLVWSAIGTKTDWFMIF